MARWRRFCCAIAGRPQKWILNSHLPVRTRSELSLRTRTYFAVCLRSVLWVRSGTKQISRSCAKWVWIGGNLKRLVLALVLREVHTSAKFSGFDFSGSNRCIKFNIVVSIWFIPIAFAQAWFKLIVVAVPGLKPQDQIWFSCPSQQHGRAQVTCYPRMGLEVSLRLRRYWLFFSLASIYM